MESGFEFLLVMLPNLNIFWYYSDYFLIKEVKLNFYRYKQEYEEYRDTGRAQWDTVDYFQTNSR